MHSLQETGVVAIVRGVSSHHMLPLAQALLEGGVRLMEVTMNTKGVLESIEELSSAFGGQMQIGAGTVLTVDDAARAIHAGATFMVTPHVEQFVIEYGVEQGVPVFSGAMTPTEIYSAYRHGAAAVKVFPSRGVGASYFREVRGPFPNIPLLAVGGVSLDNAASFLSSGAIGWGLGGSLVDLHAIEVGDFERIREAASSFVEIYRSSIQII